jgi:anti-sigma factor RsiW
MNHLDDDAELYALGLTERERDAEIEAHLAACEPCRARVVAAEAAAASLAAALPPAPATGAQPVREPAAVRRALAGRPWWPSVAVAASVVFGAVAATESLAAQSASARLARTDVALTAIASSHFGHTTLASDPGVIAKAIYARDGAWCYVVVSGAPRGAHVVMHRGTAARDLGALDPGAPATLFVRDPGRPDEIELVADGGRVVAHGKPAF